MFLPTTLKEVENFNKKLVAKLGFDRPVKGLGQIFSAYTEQMKEINKEVIPEHKIWADCIKCIHFPVCNEVALVYKLS